MKTEYVVVKRDGKYWGVQYSDGKVTEEGWGPIENAKLSDPEYCLTPTDMVYRGHYKRDELAMGTLVPITKTVIFEEHT